MALDRILGRVGAQHQLQAPGLPAGLERARAAFVIREYARLRNTPRMSPAAARPSARYRSAIVAFVLSFVSLFCFARRRIRTSFPPTASSPARPHPAAFFGSALVVFVRGFVPVGFFGLARLPRALRPSRNDKAAQPP